MFTDYIYNAAFHENIFTPFQTLNSCEVRLISEKLYGLNSEQIIALPLEKPTCDIKFIFIFRSRWILSTIRLWECNYSNQFPCCNNSQ